MKELHSTSMLYDYDKLATEKLVKDSFVICFHHVCLVRTLKYGIHSIRLSVKTKACLDLPQTCREHVFDWITKCFG